MHAVDRKGSLGIISHCGHRMMVEYEMPRGEFVRDDGQIVCEHCAVREQRLIDGKSPT